MSKQNRITTTVKRTTAKRIKSHALNESEGYGQILLRLMNKHKMDLDNYVKRFDKH